MRVVAVVNRKGGVGKTTTAVNLAAALAMGGSRTLVVDLDPQGSVGRSLALPTDDAPGAAVLFRGKGPAPVVQFVPREELTRLGVVPADVGLEAEEAQLFAEPRRRDRLGKALGRMTEDWSVAVLDTPPGLGALSDAALRAADAVVLPAVPDYLAIEALRSTVEAVRRAEKAYDRRYRPLAVLPTMVEPRRTTTRGARGLFDEHLADLLLGPEIPRTARVDAAALAGLPVVVAAPRSPAADAYLAAARSILAGLGDPPARTRGRGLKAFGRLDVRRDLQRLRGG